MERIDDLQFDGLKIIQDTDGFCFGIDSVILAHFAYKYIKPNTVIADLGAGNGVLSLLLSKKVNPKKIIAFEKQAKVAEMATRSISLNKLENVITVENVDICDLKNEQYLKKFDTIITNPPYKRESTGINSKNDMKQLARFESTADIDKWFEVSKYILKDTGSVYMCYRPERLSEVFDAMKKNCFEPKEIRFVHSKMDSESKLVLIRATKNGNAFLKILKPLIIYKDDGAYSEEVLEYYKEEKEK